jgi:hypothetical protein
MVLASYQSRDARHVVSKGHVRYLLLRRPTLPKIPAANPDHLNRDHAEFGGRHEPHAGRRTVRETGEKT